LSNYRITGPSFIYS